VEYPTPAKRSHNSLLSNEKLNTLFGVLLSPWETALDTVLLRLADTADLKIAVFWVFSGCREVY
jgi:hypothetical protein